MLTACNSAPDLQATFCSAWRILAASSPWPPPWCWCTCSAATRCAACAPPRRCFLRRLPIYKHRDEFVALPRMSVTKAAEALTAGVY